MGGPRGRLISKEDRIMALDLVDEACRHGARKHKACEIINISIRTLERWQKNNTQDNRKGAKRTVANKLSEAEKNLILEIANSPMYCDMSPTQIVPTLADNCIYIASEASFFRVLREEKQLKHRQLSKMPTSKKVKTCEATGPNQVWSWDITYIPTLVIGIYFYLYMIMDIYSRKIVGWCLYEEQSASHAAKLIQQTCRNEKVTQDQLILHSDNGTPMRNATMLEMLKMLGVVPSFSRPSVSDDNPYSEALFKTLKYHATYPALKKFSDIYTAELWVERFVDWYNNHHKHSALKFITPNQRHSGEDKKILEKRHQVYMGAKKQRPDRWSGHTRNWVLVDSVILNPNR